MLGKGAVVKRVRLLREFWHELALTVIGICVCLGLFLFGLSQVFPTMEIGAIFGRQRESPSILFSHSDGQPKLHHAPGETDAETVVVARLTFIQRDVKSKRSEDIVWSRAHEGLKLFSRDAVQTLSKSRTVITFDEKNYLDVGENSLVLLKGHTQDSGESTQKSLMELTDGSVRSKIQADEGKTSQIEITTPSAVAEVASDGRNNGASDVQVRVNSDKSSAVMVYKGRAKVKAHGVSIDVAVNQASRINPGEVPQSPQSLPEPVILLSPEERGVYLYRDILPQVSFFWSHNNKNSSYHLQVARDASFRARAHDEILSEANASYGGLKDGTYYWRVSGIDISGIEGAWSTVRRIEIVKSGVPSILQLYAPRDGQVFSQEMIFVEGGVDSHAKVSVNGKAVAINTTGHFRKEVLLKMGENEIMVESVDKKGNSSLQRRSVTRERSGR